MSPGRQLGAAIGFAGACALAPLGCMLGFLAYQGHPALAPESLLALAVVALATGCAAFAAWWLGPAARVLLVALLVTAALDYLVQWQSHGIRGRVAIPASFGVACVLAWLARDRLAWIFGAAFAAVVVSVALTPRPPPAATTAGGDRSPRPAAGTRAPEERGSPPFFVHVVLDAHIGPDGLPAGIEGAHRLREEIVAGLARHGFRVYGRAFSRHYSTAESVAALLNLDAPGPAAELTRPGPAGRVLVTRNGLFDALRAIGYRIEVVQPDGYDWCAADRAAVARCESYPYQTLRWLDEVSLGAWDEARIVVAAFARGSTVWFNAGELYVHLRGHVAPWLPAPFEPPFTYAGVGALKALRALPDRVAAAPRGTALFAHILLPHGPHVFDAACRMRPDIDDWRAPATAEPGARRRDQYARYFAQVRCVQRHIERLGRALESRARVGDEIVVIHGDHGSRIAPGGGGEAAARRGRIDALSALAALRAPGVAPGYDGAEVALDALFAADLLPALGLPQPAVSHGREIDGAAGVGGRPPTMPDI